MRSCTFSSAPSAPAGRRRVWLPSDAPGTKGAWFRADLGLTGSPVSAWADSFCLGNGTGTQATGSKRPAIVTNVVGGRQVLRGTSAAVTSLPITHTLTSETTIYAVINFSSTNSAYYFGDSTGLKASLIYGFTSNNLEWLNSSDRSVLLNGTTGYHVVSISQKDAVNIRLYADGSLISSGVPATALAGTVISHIWSDGASLAAATADIAELLIYKTAHTAQTQIEISKKLKGYYGL